MQTTDKCELDLVVARALPEYVEDIHANFASECQIPPHELKKVGHILLRNILGMSFKKNLSRGNVREKRKRQEIGDGDQCSIPDVAVHVFNIQ